MYQLSYAAYIKGYKMPSLPSIAGGGPVRGVDGSERTLWWLLAGRRGAVGIGWESSDAYRDRHLYVYSQRRGGSVLRRVLNHLGTEAKEYLSIEGGDARSRAKLLVKAYYQYCFLTQGTSGWRSASDPAALNCVKKLWPNNDASDVIIGFQDGDPILTQRQAAAYG